VVISLKYFKPKFLLLTSVITLVIIGLSYAMAFSQGMRDEYSSRAILIELVPEECKVLDASQGVSASVEFKQDEKGNIVDRTYVHLIAREVYDEAGVTFNLVARNISDMPISIDRYTLNTDDSNRSLEDFIYFSCTVKIFRGNSKYYDILGSFKSVKMDELADNLTNIVKYRKIDVTERIVVELTQEFKSSNNYFPDNGVLSYTLVPIFIQYFPEAGGE
jgi:hypothetical protein